LARAHEAGIVHRDLKPENIVRRADGQIKVLDFGLARTVEGGSSATRTRLTMAGALLGTPGYMAPEQLRGEPADRRADVYAFGVLVHELATGRRPSDIEPVTPSGAVPAPLDAIVRRCLRPRPEERFDSGLELLAALTASAESAVALAEDTGSLWWWQFHQVAVSLFHSSMLVAVWLARGLFGAPWGNIVFYAALALETAAVTMRLHLWFTSRHDRSLLDIQRRRVHAPIVVLDALFATLLLGTAAVAASADAPAAPLFVVAGITSLLSLMVIEPATSRAAFLRERHS
jgi:hypothetical protein